MGPELTQLDDKLFARVNSATLGRRSTPVEVILRALVVKRRYNFSYGDTERFVSDSITLRQFCSEARGGSGHTVRREVVVMDWQSTRVWRASLPVVNRVMGAWLRSRWHRPVSATMMMLTFEGARSGRTYSFPVGYAEDGEGLVTFTRFGWWKNFREERPVSLRLRGREMRGVAVAVRNPDVVAERFAYYLERNPHDGKYFGVRVDRDGRTTPEDLARAAARLVLIRTHPEGVRTRPDGETG